MLIQVKSLVRGHEVSNQRPIHKSSHNLEAPNVLFSGKDPLEHIHESRWTSRNPLNCWCQFWSPSEGFVGEQLVHSPTFKGESQTQMPGARHLDMGFDVLHCLVDRADLSGVCGCVQVLFQDCLFGRGFFAKQRQYSHPQQPFRT